MAIDLLGILDVPGGSASFASGPAGAFRNGEGCLEVEDASTWATIPGTWDAWTAWNSDPGSSFVYTFREIDAQFIHDFEVEIETQGHGDRLIEVDWSDDGSSYNGWANYNDLRDRTIRARFFRVRVTVTGSGVLTLCRLVIMLRAETLEETIDDLATASVRGARRFGPGDVRLPVQEAFQLIRSVSLTFNGMGAGWSWEVVDRSLEGPRVRIYNPAGQLADAVVDAVIRGL